MPIEQYTESLTLSEMKCTIGKNPFGFVFPQGDVEGVDKIENLLKKAGGKPKVCLLPDFSLGGNGKAKPEYVITFNDDTSTIIVIECKKSIKNHESENYAHPKDFAVDGVIYYAKYLKEEYNVIAVAISGIKKDNIKVSTFYWQKGLPSFQELLKARDIILEPKNYIELIKGNRLQKNYSLDEIRETAIIMHDALREIKVTEAHKPIFIAGILIALNNDDFCKSYSALTSFKLVIQNIQTAIENVLIESNIKNSRIDYIKQVFKTLQDNTKFAEIPLGHKKSITWYIEQLEMKIKPMMNYADSTLDALGVFYHEFIKYSGGDGSGLGIVLTPQHLTEFMCDLAGVNKNSRVVDICCGSASFLVTAMNRMFKNANHQEIEKIRQEGLYGVEFDDGLYTLAIANMIIRKDGKSNIYKGDCFNEQITKELKAKNINIGLINPPYSQDDKEELEFTEHLLDILVPGGTGCVVVPMSCAIGTKFKITRERLFKKHTLKAVFSMPDDIFYPTGTNVCVMVWEAHTPHDNTQETFFGYYKDDGFVKKHKFGRIDFFSRWCSIEKQWLKLYRNRDVKDGFTARACINWNDEWLCEAYMNTDYEKLVKSDFEKTLRTFFSYEVLIGSTDLSVKLSSIPSTPKLSPENWKFFKVSDIFMIQNGKGITKEELEEFSGDFPAVQSGEINNGILGFIDKNYCKEMNYTYTDEPCLTVARTGTAGFVAFQRNGCVVGDSAKILLLKNEDFRNPYTYIFLATVLNANRYKFSYGRKVTEDKYKDLILRLPANTKGAPDYQFMENYIKSLPYSDRI
ncbi:MAG: N-6 DNA methylase [Treponema sp.]|nr:N-6 DNA methylase [Treponema sp.]